MGEPDPPEHYRHAERVTDGISVIICAFNAAERLPKTLQALARCTLHTTGEIVLVDNCSTDATQAVALDTWERCDRRDLPLRIVEERQAGLSHARRKGVETAHYPIVLFCDDDNWLAPDYLDIACTLLQDASIGAVGGRGRPVCSAPLPDWFYTYARSYAVGTQVYRHSSLAMLEATPEQDVDELWGAGLAVRKEALQRLYTLPDFPLLSDRKGGALSSGGDTEATICIKLMGKRLVYSDRLSFAHEIPAGRLTPEYLKSLAQANADVWDIATAYRLLGSTKPRLVCMATVRAALRYAWNRLRSVDARNQRNVLYIAMGINKRLPDRYQRIWRNVCALREMQAANHRNLSL